MELYSLTLLYISGSNFLSSKNEKRATFKKSLIFRGNGTFQGQAEKASYISGGNLQCLKIKQKNLFKVVSYDVFSTFTTVKHSDSNGIRTHNHLIRKRTLNQLVKLIK